MNNTLSKVSAAAKDAGLHPVLAASLEETAFGPWVKHPFVISPLFIHPEGVEMLNQALKAKEEAVQEAIRSGNWLQVIWLHERPWRPDVLANHIPYDLAEFWDLVSRVWTDTEFPHLREALWRDLFTRPGAEQMMDMEEREFLDALPEFVTIYRGTTQGVGEQGFSWTLDKDRAEWFASRFASDIDTPIVIEGTVSKYEAVAYIARRGESEILSLPERVKVVTVHHC